MVYPSMHRRSPILVLTATLKSIDYNYSLLINVAMTFILNNNNNNNNNNIGHKKKIIIIIIIITRSDVARLVDRGQFALPLSQTDP